MLFLFIIWRSYVEKNRNVLNQPVVEKKSVGADIIHTLKVAGKLLTTRNMLLLLIPFAYSGKKRILNKQFLSNIFKGFSQTLFQGVYATCIGHYVKYGGRMN